MRNINFPVIQQHNLENLLFEGKGREEKLNAPFKNPLDLATFIASLPETPYHGRRGSVSSLLSQCLHGKRRFPRPLKQAIKTAVGKRLPAGNLPNQLEFLESIERELDQLPKKNPKQDSTTTPHSQSVECSANFISTARESTDCCVLLPQFREIFESRNSHLSRFLDFLIERLDLVGKHRLHEVSPEPTIRYSFYFPNTISADSFWEKLYNRITFSNHISNMSQEAAILRLRQLNYRNFLDVFTVADPATCVFPLIAFNCKSRWPNGYSFYFDMRDNAILFKWSFLQMTDFQNNFYSRKDKVQSVRRLFRQDEIENNTPTLEEELAWPPTAEQIGVAQKKASSI